MTPSRPDPVRDPIEARLAVVAEMLEQATRELRQVLDSYEETPPAHTAGDEHHHGERHPR